nr:toll/interleukin-1 receptor domain-containing protein [uncultured Rhodopila sp.]
MKLFISYGHDTHQSFVRRIMADLTEHTCWIDSEQTHKQPDWRRSLMDALHDCEWTLGFLTRHSMRPGSVTPQELAIANDVKAGCLTTVLLEPLDGWQVPVAVGHAQWVDMSEYATSQHDPAWYKAKLDELRERLSPALAETYRTEIAALTDWLDPVPQQADIARYLDGFVGREWLVDILDDWRLNRTNTRMFWLTGLPGTGKSAFSAWVTTTHQGNAVALNLCRWDLRERCDAARVIRTLAWFVARRVQDYRAQLLRLMRGFGREALESTDAATLFDRLLIQPLTHCFDGGRTADRLLLVIDGLDEAVPKQHQEALHSLLDLLRRHGPLLPPWIGLLVTSRPEQPAGTVFGDLPMLRIDADEARNRADLRLYAQGWLGASGRAAAEVAALIDAIDARADGSFIYLRKLREAHENRGLPLDKDSLPDGLNGLYDEWFRRQFPDAGYYRTRVAPLLALILAAETPVPEAVLDAAMQGEDGWDEVTAAATLQSLGSLFEKRGDGWAPFHKSLRDWLTGREKTPARHLVPVAAGHDRLAALLWRQFVTAAADPEAVLSAFLLRELPAQAASQTGATRADWVQKAGNWWSFHMRCADTVQILRDARSWSSMLAWCTLSDQLATGASEPAALDLQRWVSVERGDTLCLLGKLSAALGAYNAGLAALERLAGPDYGSPAWQRNSYVIQSKIGDVLQKLGDMSGALKFYLSVRLANERIASSDPNVLEWQRDLCATYDRLGAMMQILGDLAGALEAFNALMTISRRLAAEDPDDTKLQRDLSVAHSNIGDVRLRQGDLDAALAAYRISMAIRESLAESNRDNTGRQFDLSIGYERIGDVLQSQGQLDAALAAHNSTMAIRKHLAALDPDNVDWQRGLFVCYNKINDVLVRQGDLIGALGNCRAGMTIIERLAESDGANIEWQRDLAICNDRLGDVLQLQGDLDGAWRATQTQIRITERLAMSDRANAEWQRDLSVSYNKMGSILKRRGMLNEAVSAYRVGMNIRERLATSDSDNAQWQRDLFISEVNITTLLLQVGDRQAACFEAQRLNAQASLLVDRFPQDRESERYLRTAAQLLARACGPAQ